MSRCGSIYAIPVYTSWVRNLEIHEILDPWNRWPTVEEKFPNCIYSEAFTIPTCSKKELAIVKGFEALLIQAVSKMVNLESFRSELGLPVITQGKPPIYTKETQIQTDEKWAIYSNNIWT